MAERLHRLSLDGKKVCTPRPAQPAERTLPCSLRPTNHADENGFAEIENHSVEASPRPLSRELDFLLEQFRDRRFDGDASPRDRAEDEGSRLPCGIATSQRGTRTVQPKLVPWRF